MNKSDAKINLKVRMIGDPDYRGVIIVLSSRHNKEDVIVEWEDGTVDPINPSRLEELPVSDGKLEKEFESLADTVGVEIQSKIDEAERLIAEACALADESGLPFFTNVSVVGQPYVPETFQNKWRDLDRDFVANLTEVATSDLSSAYGWQHSQVC